MDFRSKFAELRADKGVLCVNLDPALPEQKMSESIPAKYTKGHASGEARLNFCLDMIDMVKDYAVAVKPNQQFVSGMSEEQNQVLTNYARKAGLLSIKDYKLADIGNTVFSAIFHLALEGYDAITFNPLFGNLQESVKVAHVNDLGIIVVTLPSNPEADIFMRKALVNGRPLYQEIAAQAKASDADGCVVGATGHVTAHDVNTIVKLAGDDKVLLVPGIGAQGGDASKFLGTNVMISIGRDIIYNQNPRERAAHYAHLFESYVRKPKSRSRRSR